MSENGHWKPDDPTPKSGWSYRKDDYEDLGDKRVICGMCCTQEIRYRHHVTHPDWKEKWVGSECGPKMCGESGGQHIEVDGTAMRNEAKRRASHTIDVPGQIPIPPISGLQPKWAPWASVTHVTFFTFLRRPKPVRVNYHETQSGSWALCPGKVIECRLCDEHSDLCHWCHSKVPVQNGIVYAVARYLSDPFNDDEMVLRGFPTCRFGALMLREEDRTALKELTNNGMGDYLLRCDLRNKDFTRWETQGASQCVSSIPYMEQRALAHETIDGFWMLGGLFN
jgi:hypothetical protein